MRVLIIHLTRMGEGYFCAAGVEPEMLSHIRPVPVRDRLPVALLACHGGPYDVGHVIDLGQTINRAGPPHTEDRLFNPDRAKLVNRLDEDRFFDVLKRISGNSLRELFGPELQPIGHASCGVRPDCGNFSLGCFLPSRAPRIFLDPGPDRNRIRMVLSDGPWDLNLPVTDIRLYRDDHVTPDPDEVKRLNKGLSSSSPPVLAMGLTRPFQPSSSLDPHCWLQVNNVHLRHGRMWRLD